MALCRTRKQVSNPLHAVNYLKVYDEPALQSNILVRKFQRKRFSIMAQMARGHLAAFAYR